MKSLLSGLNIVGCKNYIFSAGDTFVQSQITSLVVAGTFEVFRRYESLCLTRRTGILIQGRSMRPDEDRIPRAWRNWQTRVV